MRNRIVAAIAALIFLLSFASGAAEEISLAHGVATSDMLTARYWTEKYEASREVILTPDRIRLFNELCLEERNDDGENFLVVTANRLRLEEDPYCPALSGLELYMGNVLPLADDPPESINGRAAYGSYVVKLPIRDAEGGVLFTHALLPVSSDVHVGFLDYTAANCLDLAFKLVGARYGWGGLYGANDCSGILGQIFACFGFKFPRNSRVISGMPTFSLNLGDMPDEVKRGVIESLAPGALLYFPGHIMLYLGSENGSSFVLSAVGSMVNPDDGCVISVSGVIVNDLDVLRKNGKTWLESVTKATMVNPDGAMALYDALSALLDESLGRDFPRNALAYLAALDDLP